MAISLLGGITNPFQKTGGMSVYTPPTAQPAGTVGMSTPQGTKYVPTAPTTPTPVAMGVTAKTPANSMPTPAMGLPKTQQNPVVTPAPVTPITSTPAPTFPGLLGQAANQAGTLNTQAGTINNTATQIGQQGQMSPEELEARNQLNQMGGVANSAGLLARETSPEVYLQQGRENLARQSAEAARQSLAGTVDAYAAERAANTGAYQQQASAQNSAGGLQNAAGGLLTAAAGQAQPQLGSIGQVPFSPVSQEQGSPLGAPGGTAADAAKVQGGFNGAVAAATAPGTVQAQNTITSGTTGVNTAAQGYQQTAQNYNQMSALNSTADLQAKQVQNVFASTGLNNVSSTDYNTAINKLSGRLGSANVTALNTSLQELRTAYTNLLSSTGMTPTGSEAQSLDVLNSGSTPAQISQAIYQLQTAAYNRLQPQYQQMQQYQNAGGIGGSTGNTPTSGAQGWL